MTRMFETTAYLLNRTAYERCKGNVVKVLVIEFGAAVSWKRRAVGGALAKMTCFWEDGVHLGLTGSSGGVIVADETYVWKNPLSAEEALGSWTDGSSGGLGEACGMATFPGRSRD